ncbi:hypothetical protein ACLOJK_016293 [Asimina triloba]
MDCDRIEASIFYGPHLLSKATVPPLQVHSGGGQANANVLLAAESVPLPPVDAVILMSKNSNSKVAYRLEFQAWVAFHVVQWNKLRETFFALCEDVEISFCASGDGDGSRGRGSTVFHPPLQCQVVRGLLPSNVVTS